MQNMPTNQKQEPNAKEPLIRKYKSEFSRGDYQDATATLNAIELRYKSLRGMQLFCKQERQKLHAINITAQSSRNNALFEDYNSPDLAFRGNPTKYINGIRKHQQHRWYVNSDLFKTLSEAWAERESKLRPPRGIRRILVIGHDLAMNTGVLRSISHYLNLTYHIGGYSLYTYELNPNCNGQTINMLIQSSDIVIINSIHPIIKTAALRGEVKKVADHKPIYFYCHETKWTLDKMTKIEAERLRQALPYLHGLLVSHKQLIDIEPYGKPKSYAIVRECSTVSPWLTNRLNAREKKRKEGSVLMSGTWQERKGAEFFSKCADSASAQDLGLEFSWAGHLHDKSCYLSDKINFLGRLTSETLTEMLSKTDIFFLSSHDDPFPLAAIEAYLGGCKLLLPRATGLTEVFEGLPGVEIYEEHDENQVLMLLDRLKDSKRQTDDEINSIARSLGPAEFTKKLNTYFEETLPKTYLDSLGKAYSNAADKQVTIAVILHLYYLDLFSEASAQLEALDGQLADIYVTVPEHTDEQTVNHIQIALANRFRNVIITKVPNRGLDVGPFFRVLQKILSEERSYSYILKIHGKKSVLASGSSKGQAWRQGLWNGLLGSKQNVGRIIEILNQDDQIGILAPSEFWIHKSSRDDAFSPNRITLDKALHELDLQIPRESSFVRGTMFWARFQPFADLFSVKSIPQHDNFEEGYKVDGMLAHAYERILSIIPQSHLKATRYKEYEISESLSHFATLDLHKDEDIYILSSGPSLEMIEPGFFDNKITIGVNSVIKRIDCTYAVFKEYTSPEIEERALKICRNVFVSLYKSGNRRQGFVINNMDCFRSPRILYYDHHENERDKFKLDVVDSVTTKLFVSWSTVTTAIHIACTMGASNIILVGHDCGQINGRTHISEYNRSDGSADAWAGDSSAYISWLSQIEAQTIALRDHLRDTKGINIYSLNPYVNLSLEGNVYSRR